VVKEMLQHNSLWIVAYHLADLTLSRNWWYCI
jgi:hypothetical protein